MTKFYNTTDEKGNLLEKYKGIAKTQDAKVLALFQLYGELSSSECWKLLDKEDTYTSAPLTSYRRSINTLSTQIETKNKDGKIIVIQKAYLIKTDKKIKGIYGRPEYKWRLIPQTGEQLKLF